MENFESHIDLSFEKLTKQIWLAFDELRDSISPEKYHVLLFLLSVYKRGLDGKGDLLNIWNEPENLFPNPIQDYFNIWMLDEDDFLQLIFDQVYRDILHPKQTTIPIQSFSKIWDIFNGLDKGILTNRFPEVFDSILYYLAKSQGKYGGEFILPKEISQFVIALANPSRNVKVYNPFAGLASFGVLLPEGCSYFGQELNRTTWAIGLLRIHAYDRHDNQEIKFNIEDSMLHWPTEELYDLILACPPFNLRIGKRYRENYPEIRSIEQFLIDQSLKSLSHEGKLVAVLPVGFLFKGGREQRFREYLVENDLIDTIVSLPGRLLLNTSIPSIVIVISKSKPNPGIVKFVDASRFVNSKRSNNKTLNWSKLINQIENPESDDFLREITIGQIREFNYNLNVPRYFQPEIDGVPLEDLLDVVPGKRQYENDELKFIRIRDLKDDKTNYSLSSKELSQSDRINPTGRVISESCLLMAIRWQTLKPTYFEFTGDPVLVSNDILAFRVDESKVTVPYLINELNKGYVESQLNSYRIGTTIPRIRREDLGQVKIKLLKIEEQHAMSQGLEDLARRIRILQEERNALAHGKALKSFDEIASLKHTTGRPRQNILDWSDNILSFFKDNENAVIPLSQEFKEFYGIDLLSALQEVKRDINFISELLEKGEKGFILENYPKTIKSLYDFNKYILSFTSNGLKFNLKKIQITGDDIKNRGVDCNDSLLRSLIDNILTNAHKHGFEVEKESNEVVIELIDNGEYLEMEIRNNGKPFPKNFTKDKFISKYSTANPGNGEGLGGYDIDRIATYFGNSDWQLVLGDPIYPVKMKFMFNIKSMK